MMGPLCGRRERAREQSPASSDRCVSSQTPSDGTRGYLLTIFTQLSNNFTHYTNGTAGQVLCQFDPLEWFEFESDVATTRVVKEGTRATHVLRAAPAATAPASCQGKPPLLRPRPSVTSEMTSLRD